MKCAAGDLHPNSYHAFRDKSIEEINELIN